MTETGHVADLAAAYALNCLDEADTLRVAGHLSACPACRAEVAAYEQVAGQLALAAPQADPGPDLRRRLLAQAQAGAAPSAPGPGRFAGLRQAFGRFGLAWAVLSLALVVVLLAGAFQLRRQVAELSQARPDLRVVNLRGTSLAPEATGLIVISLDGEHGTLVVDRLPALEEARQYQLWLIRDGRRTSGGVFSVDRSGYASLWVHASQPLASYASFGVTVEPAGGSRQPTSERILGGDLASQPES